MEHLETYEEEKKRLIENSQRHKEELAEQLREISTDSKKLTTNALVIGGSLILTYLVVRQFVGGKAKKKKYPKHWVRSVYCNVYRWLYGLYKHYLPMGFWRWKHL